MILEILIGLIVVVAGLAVYISMRTDEIHVTRSAPMAAKPEKIFAEVNDLHAWNAWSPWAKLDPNSKTTFEGSPEGLGAIMRWVSDNNKVGEGSMTIIESRPNELVKLRLDFQKPMRGTNTGEFTFKTEGNQTIVTWSMTGKANFVAKAMGLFFNCEKMIGSQFEKGLAGIRAIVEAK